MENKQFQSPVYHVIAVPYEKIIPNTYNPNKVAPPEMKLLYDSIKADGFTMPIVCYYAKSRDMYVIVDGFHRYSVMGKISGYLRAGAWHDAGVRHRKATF